MGNYDMTKLNPLPRFLRFRPPLSTTPSSSLFSSAVSSVISSPSLRPRNAGPQGAEPDSAMLTVAQERLRQQYRNILELPQDEDDEVEDDDDDELATTTLRTSYSSNASSTAFDEDEFQEKEEAILGQMKVAGFASSPTSTSNSTAHPALREHHFENDGVVPMFSQWHPGDCEYVPFLFSFLLFLRCTCRWRVTDISAPAFFFPNQ